MSLQADSLGLALIDYYVAASLLLGAVTVAWPFVKQPAGRIAIAWAMAVGLASLVIAVCLPGRFKVAWVSAIAAERNVPSVSASPFEGLAQSMPQDETPSETVSPSESGSQSAPPRASEPQSVSAPQSASGEDDGSAANLWERSILLLFLTGGFVVGAWLVWGALNTGRLLRNAVPAPGELQRELEHLVSSTARPPRLLLCLEVASPVAVGLFRPAIMLPTPLANASNRVGFYAAIAHEWAHIKNRDLWLLALDRCLLLALFAHPLYWWIRRRIRDDQEVLADAATAVVVDRRDYAQELLRWSRMFNRRRPHDVAGMLGFWEHTSRISRRIKMLIEEKYQIDTRCSWRWKCSSAGLLGALVFLFSLLTVRPAPTDLAGAQTAGQRDTSPTVSSKVAESSAEAPKREDFEEVVQSYARACNALKTYDVYLRITQRFPMKYVLGQGRERKVPRTRLRGKWQPLGPGEEPPVKMVSLRQVYLSDGKRREERFDPTTGDLMTVRVFDGKTERTLLKPIAVGKRQATIRAPRDFNTSDFDDYEAYLRESFRSSLPRALLNQPGTRLLKRPDKQSELWWFESPLVPDGFATNGGRRVALDPARRFMPSLIELHSRGENGEVMLKKRFEIKRFREVAQGLPVPVEMEFTAYNPQPGPFFGKPVNQFEIVVDEEKSRWNEPLSDADFLLPFPEGTEVTDFINNTAFIAGKGDDGKDSKELRKRASEVLPITVAETPQGQSEVYATEQNLADVVAQERDAVRLLLKYRARIRLYDSGHVRDVWFEAASDPSNLQRAGAGIDDALAKVRDFHHLERLSLGGTEVTDAGMVHLKDLGSLKRLLLGNVRITNRGVENLKDLTNLEMLYLDNTLGDGDTIKRVRFTDQGMAYLADLKNLEYLFLDGTDVTDEGLRQLEGLEKLKHLHLARTRITQQGVERLQRALPNLDHVQR